MSVVRTVLSLLLRPNHLFRKMSGTPEQCTIAVAQMCSTENMDENYNICERLVKRAVYDMNAKMIFLPECFDYITSSGAEALKLTHTIDGDLMQRYRKLASSHNVWLSLGGWHEKIVDDTSHMHNSHTIVDNHGQIVSTYHKAHLFDVNLPEVRLIESDYVRPGERINDIVHSPVGDIGLATCYDIRFPDHSRMLRQRGAQIITYPSAFTCKTGHAHWHTLCRARAIENQCYVIAAAQCGRHNVKRESYGHSLIVDPWGEILVDLKLAKEDVGCANIDLEKLDKVRREMPVISHRRDEIYSQLSLLQITDSNIPETFDFGGKVIHRDTVFAVTPLSFAFVNIKPVLSGHVLVAPRRSTAIRVCDLHAHEVCDMWMLVQRVQSAIERVYKTTSSTLAVQDGRFAGQTVKHVHCHIIPRKGGDFVDPDELYRARIKLKLFQLQTNDVEAMSGEMLRTHEDMAEEAMVYRPLIYC